MASHRVAHRQGPCTSSAFSASAGMFGGGGGGGRAQQVVEDVLAAQHGGRPRGNRESAWRMLPLPSSHGEDCRHTEAHAAELAAVDTGIP